MKHPTLILLALPLAACHTAPTVIFKPDGSRVVNLGASVFEKSTDESAAVTMPDGTQIAYSKKGKDQTILVREGIRAWATVESIVAAGEALNGGEAIRENNITARQVSSDSVKKAETAADVTKATFVPPEP